MNEITLRILHAQNAGLTFIPKTEPKTEAVKAKSFEEVLKACKC